MACKKCYGYLYTPGEWEAYKKEQIIVLKMRIDRAKREILEYEQSIAFYEAPNERLCSHA